MVTVLWYESQSLSRELFTGYLPLNHFVAPVGLSRMVPSVLGPKLCTNSSMQGYLKAGSTGSTVAPMEGQCASTTYNSAIYLLTAHAASLRLS